MKRALMCLPVLVVGTPLLVAFLLASARPSANFTGPVVDDRGGALPDNEHMERLAKEDPVAFLENCVRRYNRDIKGYRLTMQKQERLGGRLQPKEIISVFFQEQPNKALLVWSEGVRKAERALYVAGENGGKLLVRPNGLLARKIAGDVVPRDVDGPDARQSGRYTLNQFGIKRGTDRTLAGWDASQKRGKLQVEYLGTHKIKEAGDRECFKLRRTYEAPENDGVTELTIYVDTESWLQVGSVLKGEDGKLIAEYFFRDIEINPSFKPGQFDREALK